MKNFLYPLLVLLFSVQGIAAQEIYTTQKGVISFFSEAPVSDVDAKNEKVKVELNASTHELKFDAAMADFDFKNDKMGRDADKKYLERQKFPSASFRGKVVTKIDYKKPGKHSATVTGVLKIHGIAKNVTEKGTIIVKQNQVVLQAEFPALLKDYNIDTPKILGKEMTADKVLVKVNATLSEQTGIAKKK
jgi:polyisoprenoid-binding protein YceI